MKTEGECIFCQDTGYYEDMCSACRGSGQGGCEKLRCHDCKGEGIKTYICHCAKGDEVEEL